MRKFTYLAPIALAMALTGCGEATESEGATTGGEALETVEAPTGQKWSDTVSVSEAGGYVMGNPDAPIKLVEYMSITCSHCATFGEQAFDSIRDTYVNSGRVSFEVRNFVRDPLDLSAAILSQCGGETPYFPLTKQALSNQASMFEKAQAMGDAKYNQILQMDADKRFVSLAEELGLISFFQQRGISEDQAKACLADEAKAETLMAQTKVAVDEMKIQGTPTFLLNGQTVEGTNWPIIETKLQEAGAR
jgi:protein-disulfide isomerase